MYKKMLITTAVALSLTACGGEDGGSSSGGTKPPASKKVTLNFFDLKEDNTASCLAYAVDSDDKITVSAASIKPNSSYSVVLHDATGKSIQVERSLTQKLTLSLDDIPEKGYLSLVKTNSSGIHHITSIEKALLPSSLNFYTERDLSSGFTCEKGTNPSIKEYSNAYIERPVSGDYYFGFNTYLQSLSAINDQYSQSGRDFSFVGYNNKSMVLAVRYARMNDEIKILNGFKFSSSSALGSTSNELKLDDSVSKANWLTTSLVDAKLTEAHLFIDGKKHKAPNAYLWQPDLAITSNSNIADAYAYSDQIGDDNYYLYLKGEQTTTPTAWQFQHVENPSTIQTELNTDQLNDQLVEFGDAQPPSINTCGSETGQCIQTHEAPNWQGAQRLYVRADLVGEGQSIRQVIYSSAQETVPVMAFHEDLFPQVDWNLTTAKAKLSYFQSDSQNAITAFLYQHQDLFKQVKGDNLLNDPYIDYLPLLAPVSTQLEQQDLLKRQSYTWSWAK